MSAATSTTSPAKYALPGDILFLSLSIYAICTSISPHLLQKGPTRGAGVHRLAEDLLMLAVQTMQAIMKDVQMREQANVIQREEGCHAPDRCRPADAPRPLDFTAFGLLGAMFEKILTSTDNIGWGRGRKIEALDFEGAQAQPPAAERKWQHAAGSGSELGSWSRGAGARPVIEVLLASENAWHRQMPSWSVYPPDAVPAQPGRRRALKFVLDHPFFHL